MGVMYCVHSSRLHNHFICRRLNTVLGNLVYRLRGHHQVGVIVCAPCRGYGWGPACAVV